jgi:hypothetical protein
LKRHQHPGRENGIEKGAGVARDHEPVARVLSMKVRIVGIKSGLGDRRRMGDQLCRGRRVVKELRQRFGGSRARCRPVPLGTTMPTS